MQQLYKRPGQLISNVMQTNGTLLTKEWAELLGHLGFTVAVSIDGPQAIHDSIRIDNQGRPTFQRAMEGMNNLREVGIDPGLLLVVTSQVVAAGAENIYQFLQEEGVTRVGLIPVRPGFGELSNEDTFISQNTFAQFLLEFECARRSLPGPCIFCREIDGVLASLKGQNPGFCEFLGGCAGHFISVEPDGDVSHCDKYIGDDYYRLGSLSKDKLETILQGRDVQKIRENWDLELEAMKTCPHFKYCRGWCPHERYLANRNGTPISPELCGMATLLNGLNAMEIKEELKCKKSH
jgi:uncharacterized protein